jgi:hypothetical protein
MYFFADFLVNAHERFIVAIVGDNSYSLTVRSYLNFIRPVGFCFSVAGNRRLCVWLHQGTEPLGNFCINVSPLAKIAAPGCGS